jgi:ferredoxin
MTTTYDPSHPKYFEEPDLRVELERVFDLCHGCRLCFNLCPSFPTLFSAIDARDGDVGAMTAAQQDKVVDVRGQSSVRAFGHEKSAPLDVMSTLCELGTSFPLAGLLHSK